MWNASEDTSDLDYIRSRIGSPRHDSAVSLSIIYGCIFLLGVSSNLVTCLVIVRVRFMHTKTNYYLLNLSISDLVVLLIALPVDLSYLWQRYPFPFGEAVCVGKTLLSEASVCSSVLTVAAFTIERYVAICHPVRSSEHVHSRSLLKIITCIWVVSFLYAGVLSSQVGLHAISRNDSSTAFKPRPLPMSTLCTLVVSPDSEVIVR